MRARLVLVVSLIACGGTVASPTLVVDPDRVREEEALPIVATAPYAKLFAPGATWSATATVWPGGGPAPTITCEVTEQRGYPEARVGFLACKPDRELGMIVGGLPRFGAIATAKGLWFTEHLSVVTPVPDDEAAALAWTKSEPLRLAPQPAPLRAEARAEATADQPAIGGQIEAFALGEAGVWCTAIETSSGADAARTVLCLDAARGIVGGGVATATGGIVTAALTWGEAPPPPRSRPLVTPLDVAPVTVTLTSPGKGKRTPLTIVATVDREQPAAYQIGARASSDDGTGARAEVEQPTMTVRGVARVTAIEPSGRLQYVFTVGEATATGPATTPALSTGVASLVGARFTGAVDPDGRLAARGVEVDEPLPTTPLVLGQLTQSMDSFVALPTEPIGVGATWTSSYPSQIVGQEVLITVTSRLTSRKGPVSVVSSTTAIAPIVQQVAGGTARLEATGTITTVFTAGLLLPTRAGELRMVASVDPTPGVANPARRERHVLAMSTRLLPR